MPTPGDAVVDFPWGRKRVLTYAVAAGDVEDVNLFDRDRRLQICTYPSGGRLARYSEDDLRSFDVLENDLTARFDPDRLEVRATHTMRVRLLSPVSTLRLRLHDDRWRQMRERVQTVPTQSAQLWFLPSLEELGFRQADWGLADQNCAANVVLYQNTMYSPGARHP